MKAYSHSDAGVDYTEEFFVNSRGIKLFTCTWLPTTNKFKALIFLCHGYGMECSIFMQGSGVRLAQEGYAVFGMDYEGHGKSQGLRAYIHNFHTLVDDYNAFFKTVIEKEEYRNKARFLFGESMGGAVALYLHLKEPQEWNGAILLAPMCKISEELKPHTLVLRFLTKLCRVIPTWKIIPSKDIINNAFKDPLRREEIRCNPYVYQQKPRLKTGLELLHASQELERNLHQVSLPILILHGQSDVVTDPEASKALYSAAKSSDKTLKLYAGMWHGLTTGEPQPNIDFIFSDIIAWLNTRNPLLQDRASKQDEDQLGTRTMTMTIDLDPMQLQLQHPFGFIPPHFIQYSRL